MRNINSFFCFLNAMCYIVMLWFQYTDSFFSTQTFISFLTKSVYSRSLEKVCQKLCLPDKFDICVINKITAIRRETNMVKDILYYPTIEFQPKDYHWLLISSLLWNRIYRIVPGGYALKESKEIQELCSTGEIGIPLSPGRYSKDVAKEFESKLSSGEWNADALIVYKETAEEHAEYCRLHQDKVDVVLRNTLFADYINENEEWLYLPEDMVNLYMTYLATHMAAENKLSLNTHNCDIWTASTFFLYDNKIQAFFLPGDVHYEPSQEALASILIKDIIPSNITALKPKDILKFREKRKDEREQFLQAIDSFSEKLTGVKEPSIFKDIINEESKKVEYALNEYKKSMDMLKVIKWGGYISGLIALGVDALGYTGNNANTIQKLTTAGLGIGLITGLAEAKFVKNRNIPYSYLTSMKKILPDNFNDHNYYLYRQIEEFIDD